MSNSSRKMCTMRKVDKVTPIEGADRVEAIRVDGWVVVDKKGLWHEGDLCVYYEIDSFLPTDDKRYEFLAQFGEKDMVVKGVPRIGHVLRTRRFRGVYSQGLLLKPDVAFPDIPERAYQDMYEKRSCLDGIANVCEYVSNNRPMSAGFIGKYDPYVAPRTDAERVQNVDDDTFDMIKRADYFVSVKVDGTSTTICYDPRVNRMRCFSHNNEYDIETGLGKTTADAAMRQGIWQWCEEHPGITVQAELCGPKIQNNRLKLKQHTLFVFSMWNMNIRCYVDPYLTDLKRLCTPTYDIDISEMTRDDVVSHVDGLKGNITSGCLDEGIVIHVIGDGDLNWLERDKLRNALGQTMQVKVINNKFLLKS